MIKKLSVCSIGAVLWGGLFSLPALADELKDIKPPVEPPPDYFWLIVLGILAIAVGLFYLIKYLKARLKKKPKKRVVVKTPWEVALEQLEKLKRENLPQAGKTKEHYIRLSDIIRHYIENRFTIRAPEMTTQEFLLTLKDSGRLNAAHKDLLKDFLNSCDMVKFAKYGPSSHEIENSNDAARRFIEETKEMPAATKEQEGKEGKK